ncbi:MAG: response regulator [Acidobacteria bacterium]|nr:response regulator [Acidobacteriota bacterium]
MHVLVVDDSKAMRSILGSILRDAGFEVSEAGDGTEALKSLQENGKVPLILVDWNMPPLDGFEFIKAVRADHTYDDTRLVMVTTETEMEQVSRALEAGANEYIMKPFTKETLLEKLALLGIVPQ